jgi:hypothetical protein
VSTPGVTGASIVTETNVSPVFFAANQTQVDLDGPSLSGQRPEFNRPVTDRDCRGVATNGGLSIMSASPRRERRSP